MSATNTSTFTLTFDTGNAAFRDDDDNLIVDAVRDILTKTWTRLDGFVVEPGAKQELLIWDVNGNRIGSAVIEEN
jgi:hypothetical protein